MRVFSLLVLSVLLLFAVSSRAGEAPQVSIQPEAGAGLQVAIDPVTGELRPPTAEEARVLAAGLRAMVNDSAVGLKTVQLASGAEIMELDGRFQNVVVMFADAEGELATECINSPELIEAITAAVAQTGPACGPRE